MATNERINVRRVEGPTEDARQTAASLGLDTHREVVPVRVFEQGGRMMLDGVLPIRVLTRVLTRNAATKGTTAAKALDANNRPEDPAHRKAIERYLRYATAENRPYIMPSLTLNCTRDVTVFVPNDDHRPITGYAVLPDEAAIYITDGQHRFLAIKNVYDELRGTAAGDRFANDSIPFMMTIENDTEQVHQDFADAGRTKPLPTSLLAVYDVRQPGNRAVMKIANDVNLFKGRVDATSSTLSINSPYLFLVNQVRQFVKSSLTGNATSSEVAFATQAESVLGNEIAFERWTMARIAFLNVASTLIPDWAEISTLSVPGGADGAEVLSKMKEIRGRRNVGLTAAFLVTLGLVSYDVLKDATSGAATYCQLEEGLTRKLEPLKDVDWSRAAEAWQGNLVVEDRIRTQTPAINAAAKVLKDILDEK